MNTLITKQHITLIVSHGGFSHKNLPYYLDEFTFILGLIAEHPTQKRKVVL